MYAAKKDSCTFVGYFSWADSEDEIDASFDAVYRIAMMWKEEK